MNLKLYIKYNNGEAEEREIECMDLMFGKTSFWIGREPGITHLCDVKEIILKPILPQPVLTRKGSPHSADTEISRPELTNGCGVNFPLAIESGNASDLATPQGSATKGNS